MHFSGNVENKLRELGIPSVVAKEIACDIMGRASALEYGLVDAKHGQELGVLLKAVKTRWNELEKPCNNPPKFHSWFVDLLLQEVWFKKYVRMQVSDVLLNHTTRMKLNQRIS